MRNAPSPRVLLGVALVAACALAMQVLLTRLFSAALFYHFAFLSISLALLGAGAGALLVYVRPAWFERRPLEAVLARWSVALALLLVATPLVLVRLDYGSSITVNFDLVVTLTIAAVLAALPFLAAGIALALAIKSYVHAVGRVYAADLAGAAVGALAIVPLLRAGAAPTLLVALGVVAGVAALLFGWGAVVERRLALGAAALAGVLAILAGATTLYRLPAPFESRFGADPVGDHWTPTSRTVGYAPRDGNEAILTYDQDYAPVPHHRRGEPLPDWRSLELGPQSIGYELTGPGHALVIGGGGGRDIFNGLSNGQRVDVIELNRGNREVVDGELARWSGAPYSLPGVSSTIGDGRSKLAGRDTKYDTVHIGFTNTLAANLGAAYALAENHLYTVEAFEEYLDHLKPGGVLNVSRPVRFTGEEALRTTLLALEALERRGVKDPKRNVAVILGGTQAGLAGTVLARLEPFTPDEVALIRRLGAERHQSKIEGEGGVAFAPGGPYRREWAELARADDLDAFCEGHVVDVCPTTDDRPFFLNSTRLQDVFQEAPPGATALSRTPYFVLLAVLGILVVLSALAFALPLRLARDTRRPPVSSLMFFAAIGLGFLVLEVALIQRFVLFLGYPTYALSVVLFSLLLFTGAGSLISTRLDDGRRALTRALAVALVAIAGAAFGLAPLLDALIDLPFAARIAVTIALLAPVGIPLGMAMPIGLRRLAATHEEGVPWAWGINGIASVLASVLAVAVAINWGFTVATLLAFACYVGALAHVLLGSWPARRSSSTSSAANATQAPAMTAT